MTRIIILLACILMVACTNENPVKGLQTRSTNDSYSAEVIRDKVTKSAFFSITTNREWKLYSGLSIESINTTTPLLEGRGSGEFELNIPLFVRSYFMLKVGDKSTIFAERRLPMEGGFNSRDLGGYKTTDGRTIKWGKLFRADEMHLLTEEDLTYLSSIPLVSVVDYRTEREQSMNPNRHPSSLLHYYSCPFSSGVLAGVDSIQYKSEAQLDTIVMMMNRAFITEERAITSLKHFFNLLEDENNAPLLFHCTGGKDRTGIGAALLLFALGVDEQTVIDDYMLSDIYLLEKFGDIIAVYPNLRPLLTVKPEYLEAGIQQMKDDYGTVERYLIEVMEVDMEKLRDIYLE